MRPVTILTMVLVADRMEYQSPRDGRMVNTHDSHTFPEDMLTVARPNPSLRWVDFRRGVIVFCHSDRPIEEKAMGKKSKTAKETPKELEGEVVDADETYERLHSARKHITDALEDIRQFLERDAPELAQDAVHKVDAAVTHSVSTTADTMIKALEEIKQRVQKRPDD